MEASIAKVEGPKDQKSCKRKTKVGWREGRKSVMSWCWWEEEGEEEEVKKQITYRNQKTLERLLRGRFLPWVKIRLIMPSIRLLILQMNETMPCSLVQMVRAQMHDCFIVLIITKIPQVVLECTIFLEHQYTLLHNLLLPNHIILRPTCCKWTTVTVRFLPTPHAVWFFMRDSSLSVEAVSHTVRLQSLRVLPFLSMGYHFHVAEQSLTCYQAPRKTY